MILDDNSPMPFGKYEKTPMIDVPVDYLHWFWHNVKAWNTEQKAVIEYIGPRIDVLRSENRNLIWKYYDYKDGKVVQKL